MIRGEERGGEENRGNEKNEKYERKGKEKIVEKIEYKMRFEKRRKEKKRGDGKEVEMRRIVCTPNCTMLISHTLLTTTVTTLASL